MDIGNDGASIPNPMEIELQRSLLPKSKLAIIERADDGTVNFCCVFCHIKYTEKDLLEVHLCSHTKVYRFLCGTCGTGLKRKEHLDRHMLEHEEKRPHVCQECGKGFKRKEHLTIHSTTHTGEKSQTCNLCYKAFSRKDHLQKHLQTHTKEILEKNIRSLREELGIKQEFMGSDEEDVKPIIIDGQVVESDGEEYDDGPQSLEDFMETEMIIPDLPENHMVSTSDRPYEDEVPNVDKPYQCLVCHKSYKRRDHLKIHSWTHMKKDKECSECGKAFHRGDQLLAHMKVHLQSHGAGDHSISHLQTLWGDQQEDEDNSLLVERSTSQAPRNRSQDRPHECPVCHRRFKRKQHLKVHANIHMKQKAPIWCSICNEGFHTNPEFENHVCLNLNKDRLNGEGNAEHVEGGINENEHPQIIQTDEDGVTQFISKTEQGIPVPQKVYVCKYCSKPFKRKDHFKIHLHIHTGVKSFFCTDCGRGFYRKDHLQKHMQVHNKNKLLKPKREIPDLYPISLLSKTVAQKNKHNITNVNGIRPEITITAPSNTKLRVPLQIKVPYQVVMSMENGEQRAVTVDPSKGNLQQLLS